MHTLPQGGLSPGRRGEDNRGVRRGGGRGKEQRVPELAMACKGPEVLWSLRSSPGRLPKVTVSESSTGGRERNVTEAKANQRNALGHQPSHI